MINFIARSSYAACLLRLAFLMLPCLLLQGCGGTKAGPSTSSELTQLQITPQASSVALGQTVQFHATGIFNDGSSQDETKLAVWTSSNSGVASIDATGFATSVSVGNALVAANVGGVQSSVAVTVSQAAIVSIAVGPPASSIALGTTAQLKATGTYTDQSTRDITNIVTWESSQPDVAVVSPAGLAASQSVGAAVITASLGSANASCQLTVLPAALVALSVSQDRSTVPLGTTAQFKAQGIYTDRRTRDLTTSVSWRSSSPGVVAVNASGLATGLKAGTATIKAASGNITGAGALTVSAAFLASIAVTSGKATMPLGTTRQMTATGTYSDDSTHDLTSSVLWSSASNQVVSISKNGVADAKALGATLISATASSISGSASVIVSAPALTSISVLPLNPTIPLESSLQFTVSGNFTDGSKQDLTTSVIWTVDNASVANLSSTGTANAQQAGSTRVEATLHGVQGYTIIVVEPSAATSYFSTSPNKIDTTFRLTNPGSDEPNLCAMAYVFDQDQQMAECCGCMISRDGLRTLSLKRDLIGNPLTGSAPVAGSVLLVTADYSSNPSCNASSLTPEGTLVGWATHLQSVTQSSSAISEQAFSQMPLSATLSSALQAQCQFIQLLGGGHGICSCGTGH